MKPVKIDKRKYRKIRKINILNIHDIAKISASIFEFLNNDGTFNLIFYETFHH
jgi:hypothetical protein